MKTFIESLWQFPVKGLGGCRINSTQLLANRTVTGDRCYAISAGSAKAKSTSDGTWLPKAHFLQLMQTEKLAKLKCQRKNGCIIVHHQEKLCFKGNLNSAKDAATFLSFMASFLSSESVTPLRLHRICDGAFTDQSSPLISIGGTASLDAFAKATQTDFTAERFRLNIILKTYKPFDENKLIGKTLQMGEAIVQIVEVVGRCAAINVNPVSACREPDHLETMRSQFGHSNLGVFGRVIAPGMIKESDAAKRIN